MGMILLWKLGRRRHNDFAERLRQLARFEKISKVQVLIGLERTF
jgi:hypothetical protein